MAYATTDQYELRALEQNQLDPIAQFQQEAEALEQMCNVLQQNTRALSTIHRRIEQAVSERAISEAQQELERYNVETRAMTRDIASRLKAFRLETARLPADDPIRQMRINRCGLLSRKLVDALEAQRQMAQQHDDVMRNKIVRQYRAARPNATTEEVNQYIDQSPGGIFASELLVGARKEHGYQVLQLAKERQSEVERILRSVIELNEMFQELQTLIEMQDEKLLQLEQKTEQIVVDTSVAAKRVETAAELARSSRKKRWFLFFFFLILLIIIVLIVVFVVKPHQQ